MKHTLNKFRPKLLATLLVLSASMLSMAAYANDEDVLKSDPINIEGYVKDQPRVTDSELEYVNNELTKQKNEIQINKEKTKKYQKLQKTTEKLAEETETYLDEKAESQKVIDQYNEKIKCLMEKKNTKECQKFSRKQDVVNTQAASVAKSEGSIEQDAFALGEGNFKGILYSGMTTINADSGQLQSGTTIGLQAEANVGSRFSFGVGFNYSTLDNTDFCLLGNECFGAWSGYYSPINNQIGRGQEYKKYSAEAYAKFFPFSNNKFRPYVGAGLSYGRSNLKYTSNNQNAYVNTSYLNANEEIQMTTVGAGLSIGAEIKFTKMFGLNIEAKYAKAVSVNQGANNPFSQYVPGQQRLNNLANDIENADNISLFAGLLLSF